MISRLIKTNKYVVPVFNVKEMRNESDVEQKLVYPFLTNASYMDIPTAWIRSKEYMSPTEIDKAAGKRYGYFPDHSIWLSGLPLVVGETKEPGVKIEVALREARMYADQVNKRYPPDVNPIGQSLLPTANSSPCPPQTASWTPSYRPQTMYGPAATSSTPSLQPLASTHSKSG